MIEEEGRKVVGCEGGGGHGSVEWGGGAEQGAGAGGEKEEMEEAVAQLMSVLGEELPLGQARRLIEMAGGNVNLAISLHFDSLTSQPQNVDGIGQGIGSGSGVDGSRLASAPADAFESPTSAHEPQDPTADSPLEARPAPLPSRRVQLGMGEEQQGPLGASSPMRHGIHRPASSAPRSTAGMFFLESDDDDDDDSAVLVHHADTIPELPSPSRRLARPGTAPASRRTAENDRDLASKRGAMRCVVGPEVEDAVLEHLLRSSGMDVQAAIEAYFDVGPQMVDVVVPERASGDERGTPASPPAPHRHAQQQQQQAQMLQQQQQQQAYAGRDEDEDEDSGGPRRPFADLCGMVGNGVTPSQLGPLMVETEGDVSKSLELYAKRKQEGTLPPPSEEDNLSAELYYLRPERPVQVVCNVYDLCWGQDKDGKKKKTNSGLAGVGLGVYHSGIEVFGREISFGYSDDSSTGVFEVPGRCAAGVMPNITFKEAVVMGTLNRSRFELDHLLQRLATKYRGDTYDLVRRNCNHFANELCVCLVGKKIPGYINRPANVGRVLLNTIQVPAMAFGRILDGVKGGGKKKEPKREVPSLVVAAPVASQVAAGGGRQGGVQQGGAPAQTP